MENTGDPRQSSLKFTSSSTEIEEEKDYVWELFDIQSRIPPTIKEEEFEGSQEDSSFDLQNGDNKIYVAVGKSDSSMDALCWTLKHAVKNNHSGSAFVHLIHVFPELRHIPTPLGMIPKSQVREEKVESYMIYERIKRRELLQKFLDKCSAAQVKVDSLLIESDAIAKALIDLIPILSIRKLVLGTTKSNLRKLRRGNGIAHQILKGAPDSCEVKIICEGKKVNMGLSSSPSIDDDNVKVSDQIIDSSSSTCFARKRM